MNIILLSEDLKFCKVFINSIHSITEKNRCYIAEDYKEFYNLLKKEKYEIILVEKNHTADEIKMLINEIGSLVNYTTKVIINSNEYNNQLIVNRDSSVEIVFETINNENIKRINNELKTNNSLLIERKIKEELKTAGFSMKNKGYYILTDVIKYCYENGKNCNNLDKNIYYNVSKIIGVSKEKIKWNIIYAINSTYINNIDSLKKYLEIKDSYKPTPKFLINSILNNLQ